MEYLSSALLSSEYERALARALAMPECPVVPFFGAFLRELREVIACETKVNYYEDYPMCFPYYLFDTALCVHFKCKKKHICTSRCSTLPLNM